MVKSIYRALACLLIGLLLLGFTPRASAAESDPFAAALDAHMPGLLAQHHVPGAVVASITAGAVAWTRAYGLADLRTHTPMRPDHLFNFGSCNKVLTAWGVMRLVDQGALDLDAPVDHYRYPGVDGPGHGVCVPAEAARDDEGASDCETHACVDIGDQHPGSAT